MLIFSTVVVENQHNLSLKQNRENDEKFLDDIKLTIGVLSSHRDFSDLCGHYWHNICKQSAQ